MHLILMKYHKIVSDWNPFARFKHSMFQQQ